MSRFELPDESVLTGTNGQELHMRGQNATLQSHTVFFGPGGAPNTVAVRATSQSRTGENSGLPPHSLALEATVFERTGDQTLIRVKSRIAVPELTYPPAPGHFARYHEILMATGRSALDEHLRVNEIVNRPRP